MVDSNAQLEAFGREPAHERRVVMGVVYKPVLGVVSDLFSDPSQHFLNRRLIFL